MSEVTERFMRGHYISKEDCLRYADELANTIDAYPKAMAAMEAEELRLRDCICSWDVDGRTPKRGCVAHAEEDEGEFDE